MTNITQNLKILNKGSTYKHAFMICRKNEDEKKGTPDMVNVYKSLEEVREEMKKNHKSKLVVVPLEGKKESLEKNAGICLR